MLPMASFAADDVVVAKINGQEIKKSDVMREMSNLPAQLQQVPVEQIYPQLLERMIDAKLVVTEAYTAKLNETEDFKSRLKRAEERILADSNLRNRIKPLITDEKLKARYDAIVAKSKPEDEVKASHILVKDEKEAKDIIEKLSKGGDFAKLATEKSTDTGSAKQGGDLGFFAKGSLVPEFAKAAFDMKPGEVSKTPVKTEFGFHVIKVTDRRKAAAVPFEKVRPQLEAQLSEELANEYVEGLKKNVKIERFNLDGTPLVAKALEAAPKAEAKPADKK
jgi:peptidyl-prolyl cis-trans isomerase C